MTREQRKVHRIENLATSWLLAAVGAAICVIGDGIAPFLLLQHLLDANISGSNSVTLGLQ